MRMGLLGFIACAAPVHPASRIPHVAFLVIVLTCAQAMADSLPIVTAGGQQDGAREYSTGPRNVGRNADSFPTRLSQLDGWHGARLVTTSRGAYTYCSCEFPVHFGVRDSDERKVLLSLIRNDREIRIDIAGCMVSFDSAYYQLFRLASEYQVAEAARWFVMPKGAQALNLDGEWAETYDLIYRPRVLLRLEKLRSVIAPDEESSLVDEICGVAATSAKAYPADAGIDRIIKSLRSRGMGTMAQKLIEGCGD